MRLFTFVLCVLFVHCVHCLASTTNDLGAIVQVAPDGSTIPPNTMATPQQVDTLQASANDAYTLAADVAWSAAACRAETDAVKQRTQLYGSNYLINAVVFCEGVGGTSFDSSNQTMRIYYLSMTDAPGYIHIKGGVKITPLGNVIPRAEYRATLDTSDAWTNLAYTASEIAVPTAYAAEFSNAYEYYIESPLNAGDTGFVRMVDSSSGMSGSGWYFVVYGDMYVAIAGKYYKGRTCVETNVVDNVTNVVRYASGINVEVEPLGGL